MFAGWVSVAFARVSLSSSFSSYLSDIEAIFQGRVVKEEKLFQDLIVYFTHLRLIDYQINPDEQNDQEIEDDDEDDDFGTYIDDDQYDDGNEFEVSTF